MRVQGKGREKEKAIAYIPLPIFVYRSQLLVLIKWLPNSWFYVYVFSIFLPLVIFDFATFDLAG